jgi:NitT/TauT family transport system substrate-binding protein
LILAVCLVGGATLLAGCGGSSGTAAGGGTAGGDTGSGGGREAIHITYAAGTLISFPAEVAESEGFFADHELEPEFISVKSGPEGITSMVTGDSDVSVNTMDNALIARGKGIETVEVTGIFESEILTLIADDKVPDTHQSAGYPENLQDLKGRSIGVVARGTTTEYALRYILEEAGIDPDDEVSIVPVGLGTEALAAMKAGRVDAVMAFEPLTTAALQAGVARTVVDLRTGEVPALAYSGNQWVTLQGTLESKPKMMSRLRATMKQTFKFMENPAHRSALVHLATKTLAGGDESLAKALIANNIDYFGPRVDAEEVKKASEFLVGAGLLEHPIEPSDYLSQGE